MHRNFIYRYLNRLDNRAGEGQKKWEKERESERWKVVQNDFKDNLSVGDMCLVPVPKQYQNYELEHVMMKFIVF